MFERMSLLFLVEGIASVYSELTEARLAEKDDHHDRQPDSPYAQHLCFRFRFH